MLVAVQPTSGLAACGEAVDEGHQADRRQDRPGDVVARVAVCLALVHDRDRRQRGPDGDGHVDAEAPAPRGVLGQHAAQDQADRRTATGDGSEDAERLRALLRIGERHRDQRQRRRCEQCAEGALESAGREEHLLVLCEAAEGGGAGEPEQADDERPLPAVVVSDPAAEQQQPAEGQRVGGEHPLPVGVGDAQVGLRRRKRDVHDRRVEDDHQLGDRDHGQGEPALGVVARHARVGCAAPRRWPSVRGCSRGRPVGCLPRRRRPGLARCCPCRSRVGGSCSQKSPA